MNKKNLRFKCHPDLPLFGEIKIEFIRASVFRSTLFKVLFNSKFIRGGDSSTLSFRTRDE